MMCEKCQLCGARTTTMSNVSELEIDRFEVRDLVCINDNYHFKTDPVDRRGSANARISFRWNIYIIRLECRKTFRHLKRLPRRDGYGFTVGQRGGV
jgi:hypothetical protein